MPDPETNYQMLEQEIVAFIRCSKTRSQSDEFDTLARRIFAYQFENNSPYQNYCRSLGIDHADDLKHWTAIPAIPTEAFKTLAFPISTFPIEDAAVRFETSGTTSDQAYPGHHHFLTTTLY
ncbi:MAG: hypothetical protein AAGD22_17735, partial [Verrucomicrobiota bacterium]